MEEKKQTKPGSRMIFISYGRKDAQELAIRLEEDLKKQGHDVWLDIKQIRAAEPWEPQIEDAILNAEILIALLSPHAVRRPDGVCLDEISMARYKGRKIVPVMVLKCLPPLGIYRLDWIDFQNWEIKNQYDKTFKRLINTINQEAEVEGIHARIFSELEPMDFGAEVAQLTLDFTGRKWLLDELDEWLEKEDGRVFFITGDPGTGKSAIMARLIHKHPQVIAYHFCTSNVEDSLNPNLFLRSIAAQLATQLDSYCEALEDVNLEGVIASGNPGTLMRRVIIDPLKAEHPDKPVIIVIDGLDEAIVHHSPNIVTVLRDQLKYLPPWVRLVLSSRKEPEILDSFSQFKPHEIEASRQENLKDVKKYLEKGLIESKIAQKLSESGASTENVAKIISRMGAGNFLYVKEAIKSIKDGLIDPNRPETFPKSLIGRYMSFFKRIFPESRKYGEFRPILDVILAAREPLTAKQIGDFLDRDGFEIEQDLEKIASFFPERDGRYQSYHKALTDWLLGDIGSARTYRVNIKGGHRRIAERLLKTYRDGKENMYMLDHLSQHLLFLEKWDDLADLLSNAKYLERIDIPQLNTFPESLLTKYYGVKPEQTKVLMDLRKLAAKALPRVEKLDSYVPYGKDEKEYDTYGVKIDGNNIVGLALCYSDLTILPDSISNLKSLIYLSLSSNKFTTLPESIGDLKSLEKLYLWNNNLTTLPESISNLKSLQTLYLSSNKFTTFPESIGELKSLEYLNLWNNNLTTLPESIGELKSLERLYLSGNQLSTLPESIGNLSSLQILLLEGNQLTTFPESIGDLSSLKELDLRLNKLTTLPESIKILYQRGVKIYY